MKKLIAAIFVCFLAIEVCAVDYAPIQAPFDNSRTAAPAQMMRSVNSPMYMESGSMYCSTVYDVGSDEPAWSPMRKSSGFDDITTGEISENYDPKSPQYGTLGDAFVPMLLMALLFAGTIYRRQRRRAAE